jgi:hypothetical protein
MLNSWLESVLLIVVAACVMASCAPPAATPTSLPPVAVTPTRESVFGTLAAATPLPTVAPTTTTAPTNSPPPTATPRPSPSSTPCPGNDAAFVADVTIPDDTFIKNDEQFTKTWRIRNSGRCTWGADYRLAYSEGARMAAPDFVELAQEVRPGQTVDVSVIFVAPGEPGPANSKWQMQDTQSTPFGKRMYVKIFAGQIDRIAGVWRGQSSGAAEGGSGAESVSAEETFEIRAPCANQRPCLIVPLYAGGTETMPFSAEASTAGAYCFSDGANLYCFTPQPDGTLSYQGSGPLWAVTGQLRRASN